MGEAKPQEDFKMEDFLYRTTDGSTWDADDGANYDFAGFFDWMQDNRQLLLAKGELNWIEQQVVPERPVDVFVNLSCGMQFGPHLTIETVDVFKALGVDFIAGAGRQFCCGKVYRNHRRPQAGEKMSQSSIDRFLATGAKLAVHGCPSCQIVYSDYVTRNGEETEHLQNQHLSAFLVERLRELGDRVPWKKRIDAKLLTEYHGVELSPVHRDVSEAIISIAGMIPGVEVVGRLAAPSRGAACKTRVPGGPSVLADLSEPEHQEVVAELEAQARERGGASRIITHDKFCHREWSKFSSERLAVQNYISLVAEALGVGQTDRYQAFWKLGDPEKVLAETRPYWQSWGISEADARTIAQKNFGRHFAGFVNPACACNGDPSKCNTGKNTLAREAASSGIEIVGHQV